MINDDAILILSEEFQGGRGSDVRSVFIGTDSLFFVVGRHGSPPPLKAKLAGEKKRLLVFQSPTARNQISPPGLLLGLNLRGNVH